MPSQPPLIQVKGLRIERDSSILKRVDWEIFPHQQWVILGANGSGKTSLIKALTGYLMPTAGTIKVLGQEYGQTDWQLIRQKIGLVSTSLAQQIQPDETALSIVASGKKAIINLWKNPSSQEVKQAQQILRKIGCSYLTQRIWSFLSQGERQRVLIGRALMANFTLLFLDEPCAGLDPVARENFLTFIKTLMHNQKKLHFVLITHHVEEIISGFTHALLLRQGKVIASGKKIAVLTDVLLTQTFQHPLKIQKKKGRYSMQLKPVKQSRACL